MKGLGTRRHAKSTERKVMHLGTNKNFSYKLGAQRLERTEGENRFRHISLSRDDGESLMRRGCGKRTQSLDLSAEVFKEIGKYSCLRTRYEVLMRPPGASFSSGHPHPTKEGFEPFYPEQVQNRNTGSIRRPGRDQKSVAHLIQQNEYKEYENHRK